MSQPGNQEFWSQVKGVGRSLSLISDKEAKRYGGSSNIPELKAEEACCKPSSPEFLTLIFSRSSLLEWALHQRSNCIVICIDIPSLYHSWLVRNM